MSAPKCPVSHYQQDGHFQTAARKGRVNCERNGRGEGPRPHPLEGYVSYKAPITGDKARVRPESFADHHSQPRQVYSSQAPTEQGHIAAALIFELSKCAEPGISFRIVAHLRNIDELLAETVAEQPGITPMPAPAPAAAPTRTDLAPSPALSIAANPPGSFHGRVLGVMVSDGFDGKLLMALRKAVAEAKGLVKLIGPRNGGAPSILFDAVALIPGTDSMTLIPAALGLAIDAFQHCKYIGWAESAKVMPDELGLIRNAKDPANSDPALCALTDTASSEAFVTACKALRHWQREALFQP